MSLGENIRYYRKRAGMYQSALGEKLGVSAQAVSKWEVGKAEPDQRCIEKMCKLFGVSADKLLGIVSTEDWNPDDMDYADKEDETIKIMTRGMKRMSAERRQKLLEIVRLAFSEDFDEEGHKRNET